MEILLETVTVSLLALVLALDTVTATEDGVLLKDSEYQKITSNTLKWISPSPPRSIPQDAVVGSVEYIRPEGKNEEMNITDRSQLKGRKIYICRAFLDGIWVPGAIFEHTKLCIVTMANRVQETEHYDILINIDQAARLVWQNWERQVEIPRGAVSAGEYYVAHTASPELEVISETVGIGMLYRIGKIDPTEGIFGKLTVLDENKELVYDVPRGQILVEIQPLFYELIVTSLTHTREKILYRRARKLNEVTLRNDDNREMKAESVITYKWEYESSWGQGKAMSKGLETRIQFRNSTYIQTISWGMPYVETKDCIENVEKILPAGTASHVRVTALLHEKEVPYTGVLLSVFDDRSTMNRTIHGIWKYNELTNITVTYGPLYFMQNNSLVPTTTTTTTEEPSTTTSTITTTIPSTTKSMNFDDQITADPDKGSGALQLENKETADKNGSFRMSSFQFPVLGSVFIVSFFSYSHKL